MDLREIRYFVQIAQSHSYTKAAECLFISQPALSKTMKKLEKELQVQLLDIRPNGVYLTDYGELFYEKALVLLNEFSALQNVIKDARGIENRELRVGVTPMLGTLYLVDIIVGFTNQHPGVEIKVTENGSKELRRQLIEGRIDLALCIAGDESEQTQDLLLFQDEMVVCVNSNNPLAKHELIKISELKNEQFNFYSSFSTLYTQIRSRCIEAGFTPSIHLSSSKVNMLLQMTARDKGICILPRPYARRQTLPNLKLISFKEPFPWIGCIVKPKDVYQTIVSRRFEEYVCKYFQQKVSKKELKLSEEDMYSVGEDVKATVFE